MPIYGVSVTKSVEWHGQPEEFSNTYHYNSGLLDNVTANALLDQLVPLERGVHGSNVNFKEARVWEAGGSPQENETILIRDISGAGVLPSVAAIYRECCVVVKLYLGRKSTTGRRIYLKKFVRPCALPSNDSDGVTGGRALIQSNTDPFKTYGNSIKNLTVAGIPDGARLCAPDGTGLPLGTDAEVIPWLSVRQFRG